MDDSANSYFILQDEFAFRGNTERHLCQAAISTSKMYEYIFIATQKKIYSMEIQLNSGQNQQAEEKDFSFKEIVNLETKKFANIDTICLCVITSNYTNKLEESVLLVVFKNRLENKNFLIGFSLESGLNQLIEKTIEIEAQNEILKIEQMQIFDLIFFLIFTSDGIVYLAKFLPKISQIKVDFEILCKFQFYEIIIGFDYYVFNYNTLLMMFTDISGHAILYLYDLKEMSKLYENCNSLSPKTSTKSPVTNFSNSTSSRRQKEMLTQQKKINIVQKSDVLGAQTEHLNYIQNQCLQIQSSQQLPIQSQTDLLNPNNNQNQQSQQSLFKEPVLVKAKSTAIGTKIQQQRSEIKLNNLLADFFITKKIQYTYLLDSVPTRLKFYQEVQEQKFQNEFDQIRKNNRKQTAHFGVKEQDVEIQSSIDIFQLESQKKQKNAIQDVEEIQKFTSQNSDALKIENNNFSFLTPQSSVKRMKDNIIEKKQQIQTQSRTQSFINVKEQPTNFSEYQYFESCEKPNQSQCSCEDIDLRPEPQLESNSLLESSKSTRKNNLSIQCGHSNLKSQFRKEFDVKLNVLLPMINGQCYDIQEINKYHFKYQFKIESNIDRVELISGMSLILTSQNILVLIVTYFTGELICFVKEKKIGESEEDSEEGRDNEHTKGHLYEWKIRAKIKLNANYYFVHLVENSQKQLYLFAVTDDIIRIYLINHLINE